MAGPRAGSPGPRRHRTIIDDGCEKRRQPADPCNLPFLPCPHRNGGAGKGYVPQWLSPVDLPSLPAYGDPVSAPTGPRRFGSLVEAPRASSVVVADPEDQ